MAPYAILIPMLVSAGFVGENRAASAGVRSVMYKTIDLTDQAGGASGAHFASS